MKSEQKRAKVDELKDIIESYNNFYLTDMSGLNSKETSDIRRKCFQGEIKLKVVKNTLFKLALEKAEGDYKEMYEALAQNTSVMFSNSANAPGKLIKKFKSSNGNPKLKAAFIDGAVFMGEYHLETLASLKTKEELVGDIILALQSPMNKLLSQLNSGKNILGGVVKTLSERE